MPSYPALDRDASGLGRPALNRLQFAHHGYPATDPWPPPRGADRRGAPGPAHAADQAVHHQKPANGVYLVGRGDRHRGGGRARLGVVVLARRDDLADPGRRAADVAPGAAHLLRRGGRRGDLRPAEGQGWRGDRGHHRADRGLRRRPGPDPQEARRPGPAWRPDAAGAAGPYSGPGQAASPGRGVGLVGGAQAGRWLLVRRRLRGVGLRRQDARGRPGRRVRQGHRRRDQGPAAVRCVRRAARLGAAGGVPARLQCLHAPGRGRGGLRHRGAPVARSGLRRVRDRLGRAPARRALRRRGGPLAPDPRPRHRPRRAPRPARSRGRDRTRDPPARRRADALHRRPGRVARPGYRRRHRPPARRGRTDADQRLPGRCRNPRDQPAARQRRLGRLRAGPDLANFS
jgi:hypothetical protein